MEKLTLIALTLPMKLWDEVDDPRNANIQRSVKSIEGKLCWNSELAELYKLYKRGHLKRTTSTN